MIGTQGRNTTWSQFVSSYLVRYSSRRIIFSSIFDSSNKEKVEHSFKRTLLSRDHFINGNRCVIANGRVRYFGNLFFKKMNFSIGFGVIGSFKIWKIQGGGVLSEILLVVAGGMNIFWNHTFGKNSFPRSLLQSNLVPIFGETVGDYFSLKSLSLSLKSRMVLPKS